MTTNDITLLSLPYLRVLSCPLFFFLFSFSKLQAVLVLNCYYETHLFIFSSNIGKPTGRQTHNTHPHTHKMSLSSWWNFFLRRVDEVQDALSRLTTLGRFQAFLLLANLIGTFVVIYVVSAETRSEHPDSITICFGIEFIVLSMISFAYSVAVENLYAFFALIVLQVEFNAFGTSSAIVGVLQELSVVVRWVVVSCNWAALIVFLLLQRVVRQTWGWHQYQLVGSSVTAVEAYNYYQQFSSALILDAFHSIFFVTAERVVRREPSLFPAVASIIVPAWTLVSARPLQLVVRSEQRKWIGVFAATHVVGFAIYIYFAVTAIINIANSQGDVADPHDLSATGERILLVASECCVVLVRLYFLFSVVRVMRSFRGTLTVMFPKRAALEESTLGRRKTAYMIDANSAGMGADRNRQASVASTLARSPRYSMYDATKNHSGNIVAPNYGHEAGSSQRMRAVEASDDAERQSGSFVGRHEDYGRTVGSVPDFSEYDREQFGPSCFMDNTPRENQSLLS